MKLRHKQLIRLVIQFIKLQLAGGIIFFGTYIGYFVSDYLFNRPTFYALAISSLIAHGIFFLVTREWIFDKKTGKKRTRQQIVRFSLFMGLNYILNLIIIEGLRANFGLSPYIGQLISGLILGLWGYIGLKFWVFQEKLVRPVRRKTPVKKIG